MNILRILLVRLGLVGVVFLTIAGARLAIAETIQVDRNTVEFAGRQV